MVQSVKCLNLSFRHCCAAEILRNGRKRTATEFETFACSRFNMEKINIFAH
jgi:hypothetical protein